MPEIGETNHLSDIDRLLEYYRRKPDEAGAVIRWAFKLKKPIEYDKAKRYKRFTLLNGYITPSK